MMSTDTEETVAFWIMWTAAALILGVLVVRVFF